MLQWASQSATGASERQLGTKSRAFKLRVTSDVDLRRVRLFEGNYTDLRAVRS